jgi:hypothetical protein
MIVDEYHQADSNGILSGQKHKTTTFCELRVTLDLQIFLLSQPIHALGSEALILRLLALFKRKLSLAAVVRKKHLTLSVTYQHINSLILWITELVAFF